MIKLKDILNEDILPAPFDPRKNKIKKFFAKIVYDNSDFEGRWCQWTEPYGGIEYSKVNQYFYHVSYNLIKKFQADLQICTNNELMYATKEEFVDQEKAQRIEPTNMIRYLYRISVPKNTELEIRGENERRIELTTDMTIEMFALIVTYKDPKLHQMVDVLHLL